jgi:hypothetical protein
MVVEGSCRWKKGAAGMAIPGKFQILLYSESDLQVLLYNFDVNSAELKPQHRAWIGREIAVHPPARPGLTMAPQRTREMEWLIVGLASRSGSDTLNWNLAKRRAAVVSDAIWLLNPGLLPVETKFGVGEEAARLAGLKDGLEDERWRSVFLRLYDPSKIKIYGPIVRPPVNVERRYYAKFLLKDEPSKSIPMDPQDRRAEKIFQASRQATQYLGLNVDPSDEKTAYVPDTWTVIKVEFWTSKNSSKDLWKFEYLEVLYTWGPAKGPRMLVKRSGSARTMSDDEMRDWVNSPVHAYRFRNL